MDRVRGGPYPPKVLRHWLMRIEDAGDLGVVCAIALARHPPAKDDRVDGEHDEPRPDRGAHAKGGDADREQKDGRYGQAPDQEEARSPRVRGFA